MLVFCFGFLLLFLVSGATEPREGKHDLTASLMCLFVFLADCDWLNLTARRLVDTVYKEVNAIKKRKKKKGKRDIRDGAETMCADVFVVNKAWHCLAWRACAAQQLIRKMIINGYGFKSTCKGLDYMFVFLSLHRHAWHTVFSTCATVGPQASCGVTWTLRKALCVFLTVCSFSTTSVKKAQRQSHQKSLFYCS